MNNKIYPCLWFDGNASQAATFYCSIFNDSSIDTDTSMVTTFYLNGTKFMGLNGGPQFQPNPAMSFYVICESEEEIVRLWNKFSAHGKIMMSLNSYDWSKMYGWVQDKFKVSWQLTLDDGSGFGQKIIPALMFTGDQFGRAEEAMESYTSIFADSGIDFIHRYDASDKQQAGKIAYATFQLLGQKFIAMDSGASHAFEFSEGNSLVVECDNQQEIDHYWNAMTREGTESRCGWLKDKFSLSWQIIPSVLSKLMSDPVQAERTMQRVLQMKKFDLEKLLATAGN